MAIPVQCGAPVKRKNAVEIWLWRKNEVCGRYN